MTEKEKSKNELLQEKLFLKRESSWSNQYKTEKEKIFTFVEEYKSFMKKSKTERLCVETIISQLESNGFKNIDSVESIQENDKIYKNIKDKTVIACMVGKEKNAFQLIGSHIDSPRLDLKPSPLYQDGELSLMQTHYYGGIKKFHWVNTPLELHGIIFTKNNKKITISIGAADDEPKFIIPDLLPHLARDQMKKDAGKIIEGEDLNIICGHIPITDNAIKDKIKFNVMNHLHEQYGIIEEDFNCAELELVPAQNPIDIGFDKALVGCYGQDDKACAYTSLRAILDIEIPNNTAVTLFVDKEEIGSTGDTGAESFMLLHFAIEYIEKAGLTVSPHILLNNSRSISADVTAAFDPNFAGVMDSQNTSYLGKGISIEKYGGSRGKYGTHDAHAEYMHYLRSLADKNNIPWQTGELGKIDLGGGGTIGMLLSRYGMDCVDAGPCLLGMHSTCEVASKADLYAAYNYYKVFLAD